MGFRENLKAELAYKDILIKELAALSGVNRRTIDNYLREDGAMPSADAAVRIAGVLGVTVEYLITGREQPLSSGTADSRFVLKSLKSLNSRDQKIVVKLVNLLNELEQSETRRKK